MECRASPSKEKNMKLNEKESWDTFAGRLRSYVRKRVSDPNDVDDILQEIFLKMHSGLGSLRDENRLSAWLYRIAKNAVIDYYRSRKAFVALTDEFPENEKEEETPAQHIAQGLAKMVDLLPEKYREAIKLAESERLPLSDVAKRLHLSLPGAKSRVQRGRALLRAELAACCHFEFDRRGGLIDYKLKPRCCRECCSK